MSNFVSNKLIICDDQDPLSMKCHTKNPILYKDNHYKTFVRGRNRLFHLFTFNNLQNRLKSDCRLPKELFLFASMNAL